MITRNQVAVEIKSSQLKRYKPFRAYNIEIVYREASLIFVVRGDFSAFRFKKKIKSVRYKTFEKIRTEPRPGFVGRCDTRRI